MQKAISLQRHQTKEHWRVVKRIGDMQPKSAPIPSTALDDSGEEHFDPSAVAEVWEKAWAKLAKHDPENRNFSRSFHARVETRLEECIEQEQKAPAHQPLTAIQQSAAAALNQPISLSEVRASIRRLQNGKAAGCDGLVSEVLKNGGKKMFECLHAICCSAFDESKVPLDWLRGVVVPLYKDGDKRIPTNYRPITLLSIAGKVYTGVLQSRLIEWAEANGVIVEEQAGFRPTRGCPEQLYTLTELIKMRRHHRQRTFACFIDIRKAYDTVWHDGLKLRLQETSGCTGHNVSRDLQLVCSGGESTIRLGGELGYTDFFPIETGVRQGCILSPILYSIFINQLATQHQSISQSASPSVLSKLTLLLYADDIVLLAESEDELQELMELVGKYARLVAV